MHPFSFGSETFSGTFVDIFSSLEMCLGVRETAIPLKTEADYNVDKYGNGLHLIQ